MLYKSSSTNRVMVGRREGILLHPSRIKHLLPPWINSGEQFAKKKKAARTNTHVICCIHSARPAATAGCGSGPSTQRVLHTPPLDGDC